MTQDKMPKIDWREYGAPKPVWLKKNDTRRNIFVLFRRDFQLKAAPDAATLHVFADSRYRLWVNGKFVETGPARFVTQHPEYDTVDLRPHLKEGKNAVVVEVNHYGTSSYQTMPDGRPGFVAWGKITGDGYEVDLATPGDWQVRDLDAWSHGAPLFSFAQGPVEICDSRELQSKWYEAGGKGSGWQAPANLIEEDAPWGELASRTAPTPDYEEREPHKIVLVGTIDDFEDRYGFQVQHPERKAAALRTENPCVAFSTWLHSPKEQTVRLALFWSELTLNGEPIEMVNDDSYGNRGYVDVQLLEGWNVLSGWLEVLAETWTYLLGIPHESEVEPRARCDLGAQNVFNVSPTGTREEAKATLRKAMASGTPSDWEQVSGEVAGLAPARQVAWDRLSEERAADVPYAELAKWGDVSAPQTVWNFRYEDEYVGHVVIDIEGPAGSIVDISYDEWLRHDKCADLYRSNPFFDATDRYILRGGRQQIVGFHSRGGKFLQVTLRTPSDEAKGTLHSVKVRDTRTVKACDGAFESSDDLLNWAWQASMNTLIGSTEDAYSDSPWRERGSYIGDCLVNIHLHLLCSSDLRAARRVLRVFAQAALPDGQLACCAPAWLRKPHEDFTLHWIRAVRDYWAATGDTDLIREVWPAIENIWSSSSWPEDDDGLWDMTGKRVFIDWGCIKEEREGSANGVVNVLRVAALQQAAEMAEAIDDQRRARQLRKDAKRVEKRLFKVLWIEKEGRLAAFRPVTGEDLTPALHANILALHYNLGEEEQQKQILAYLTPLLKKNFKVGRAGGQFSGYAELYFFFYLLPALVEHGQPKLAEQLVHEHYEFLRSFGDQTLPECFSRVDRGVGSRCHSWSGAAAVYGTRHVLGFRQAEPGDLNHFVLEPVETSATFAKGRIPHPKGMIEVEWWKEGEELRKKVKAPEGVTVE